MAMICRASSRIALMPFPGSRPACAETPRAIISNWPTPLRLVFSAPPGNDGSNTSTASLLRGLDLDQPARGGAADLLIGRPQHHELALGQLAAVEQRARRQRRETDAGFHVEHAGAVQLAALALQRHRLELPDRPHRVEVAEQQDLARAAAEGRSQVSAGGRRLDAGDLAAKTFQPRGQFSTAAIDRRRIVTRRFDCHERLDELEQPFVVGEAVVEVRFHRGLGVLGDLRS